MSSTNTWLRWVLPDRQGQDSMALSGKSGKEPYKGFSHNEAPVCLDRLCDHFDPILTVQEIKRPQKIGLH